MLSRHIPVERATRDALAPFGTFASVRDDMPRFAAWPGVEIIGGLTIDLATEAEILVVQMAARPFPHQCSLLERHFHHTQTYLPFNGKPFVMMLGEPTEGDLPNYATLRAFLFDDSSGIILHKNVWHDFPYALEDDTQFAVLLSAVSHLNTDTTPRYELDAEGPDLQRRAMRPRAELIVDRPDRF